MPTDNIDFSLMLLLGLASSLHCVTMCGPLIAVASAPLNDNPRSTRWTSLLAWQAAYHAGRGAMYVLAGMAAAAAGVMIGGLFPSRAAGGVIQLTIGCGICLLALSVFFNWKSVDFSSSDGRLNRWLRKWMTSGHGWGMLMLGLLTGFLPCGVLYAAFARALVASSIWQGGLLMLAFWLGTTPLLMAVGLASGGLFRWAGKAAALLLALAMLSTGLWLAFKGYRNISHPLVNPKTHPMAASVAATR
jgi:sulfite exporter TauE/SafE